MTQFLDKLPFAKHTWFRYLRLLVSHFLDDNCTQKAASLTYTTLLSIVPMLAILLVIFSSVPALEGIREQVQETIYRNLLPSVDHQLQGHIDSFAKNSAKMTVVGVGALLFTTIMTLITIEDAFNQIWRTTNQSKDLHSILRSMITIIATPIILIIAFIASSAIRSIDSISRHLFGYGLDWSIWAVGLSFLTTIAGFILLYWFTPKTKVPLKNAVIAGITIAILFECIKRVFGLAVTNFTSYEAVYGAFAILPIFLLWIYISWNLILLGVEISYTLTIFDKNEEKKRPPFLILLTLIHKIYHHHKQGKKTPKELLYSSFKHAERDDCQEYLHHLENQEFIAVDKSGNYYLTTELNHINLWQFYRTLPYSLPDKQTLSNGDTKNNEWQQKLQGKMGLIEHQTKTLFGTSLADLFETNNLNANNKK